MFDEDGEGRRYPRNQPKVAVTYLRKSNSSKRLGVFSTYQRNQMLEVDKNNEDTTDSGIGGLYNPAAISLGEVQSIAQFSKTISLDTLVSVGTGLIDIPDKKSPTFMNSVLAKVGLYKEIGDRKARIVNPTLASNDCEQAWIDLVTSVENSLGTGLEKYCRLNWHVPSRNQKFRYFEYDRTMMRQLEDDAREYITNNPDYRRKANTLKHHLIANLFYYDNEKFNEGTESSDSSGYLICRLSPKTPWLAEVLRFLRQNKSQFVVYQNTPIEEACFTIDEQDEIKYAAEGFRKPIGFEFLDPETTVTINLKTQNLISPISGFPRRLKEEHLETLLISGILFSLFQKKTTPIGVNTNMLYHLN
ncbi:hypothetical protein AA313_de0210093 [Arthrobotrys entomopaga]|nr:hypothetical protein AA313_de0210093 [Arthrobotrys entomopaga]